MIRAPHALLSRPKEMGTSPFSFALALEDIQRLAKELTDLKTHHEAEHQVALKKIADEHAQKMTELDAHVAQIHKAVTTIYKGEPGTPAPIVDEKALENRVLSRIRPAEDGKTPVVDHEAIAQKAAKIAIGKIKIPKPDPAKPVKNVDPKDVAAFVIETIKKDKPLKMEHIADLLGEIASYRSQLAGKHYGENTQIRGGGDVVTAGSNVTITTDANGKKVISSSGGSGFTVLAATETPDGSRTTFTFALAAAQPTFLVLDGMQKPATSKAGATLWTWNNGTKVATVIIPPNDDIYGIT